MARPSSPGSREGEEQALADEGLVADSTLEGVQLVPFVPVTTGVASNAEKCIQRRFEKYQKSIKESRERRAALRRNTLRLL